MDYTSSKKGGKDSDRNRKKTYNSKSVYTSKHVRQSIERSTKK
jgi:hypothetical protein